jgi:hypothetical protein
MGIFISGEDENKQKLLYEYAEQLQQEHKTELGDMQLIKEYGILNEGGLVKFTTTERMPEYIKEKLSVKFSELFPLR